MEFNFKFTQQELQVLVQGLAELPAKVSMGLIDRLQKEVTEQFNKFQNDTKSEHPIDETFHSNGVTEESRSN